MGQLDLVRQVFDQVVLPTAVVAELQGAAQGVKALVFVRGWNYLARSMIHVTFLAGLVR